MWAVVERPDHHCGADLVSRVKVLGVENLPDDEVGSMLILAAIYGERSRTDSRMTARPQLGLASLQLKFDFSKKLYTMQGAIIVL